jgi:hypothetical protein
MVLPRSFGGTMTTISATRRKSTRRGGRPKIAEEDVRKAYGVKLSKRELDEARQLAAEAGLSLSAYCRSTILKGNRDTSVPLLNRQAWLALVPLARALISMARHQIVIDSASLSSQLGELEVLLRALRFSLLGINLPEDGRK